MFKVGDRVRILADGELEGRLGTVRLITEENFLDYVVDVDGWFSDDPLVESITAAYGVDAGCVPYDSEQLELVESADA